MPSIEIGSDWRRFDLCYDSYRKKWEAMAIVPVPSKELFWFKGWGVTIEEAMYDLKQNIISGTHLGKIYQSKYVQVGKSNGLDSGKPRPELKDFF